MRAFGRYLADTTRIDQGVTPGRDGEQPRRKSNHRAKRYAARCGALGSEERPHRCADGRDLAPERRVAARARHRESVRAEKTRERRGRGGGSEVIVPRVHDQHPRPDGPSSPRQIAPERRAQVIPEHRAGLGREVLERLSAHPRAHPLDLRAQRAVETGRRDAVDRTRCGGDELVEARDLLPDGVLRHARTGAPSRRC